MIENGINSELKFKNNQLITTKHERMNCRTEMWKRTDKTFSFSHDVCQFRYSRISYFVNDEGSAVAEDVLQVYARSFFKDKKIRHDEHQNQNSKNGAESGYCTQCYH